MSLSTGQQGPDKCWLQRFRVRRRWALSFTLMTIEPTIEIAVRRELLRLALRNSERSIPLQLLAVGIVVVLSVLANVRAVGAVAAVFGLTVSFWRFAVSRRYADVASLSERQIASATRELEGNSALAGLLWAVCSVGIYPVLQGTLATTYIVIAIGSVAIAALFMSLVGRSFFWLVTLSLGSLVVVSLWFDSVRSYPVAGLVGLLGLTMLRASREVSDTTRRAISHSLEADVANASLSKAKEAAEAANLAKSQFLATMSHEIRTPMNGVLGALDLLRHSTLDANQRRLVNTAASSGTSLMSILDDVLDHSKIEAGKLNLVLAPMSLHAMVASVTALFRGNATSKGLSLKLELDSEVQDWLIGDAQRIKQVLLNLIGNAIKFTERGGVVLRLSPRPAPAGWACIGFEVSDSGVGMLEEALERLFQPFHQIESGRRGGTGLGLAISQRLIEAMGSRIEVKSRPGKGSRFRFNLLLECDQAASHPAVIDSAMGALDNNAVLMGTVLVVEDNEVNRMIARELLRSFGVQVVEAGDGAQAVEVLSRQHVDLVLMDCQMPVMDGYQATEEIRRREAQQGLGRMPILALTANAFEEDAERARQAGMDGHLAKPYTRAQLRELLSAWL